MADIHIHREHAPRPGQGAQGRLAMGRGGRGEVRHGMHGASRARPATPSSSRAPASSGRLIVAADHFDLEAKLGFLLGAFSKTIEAEIEQNLDALLAERAPAAKPAAKAARRRRSAPRGAGGPGAVPSAYFSDSIRSTYSCIASSLRLALDAVPGVPLGAADHVGEARALALDVAARWPACRARRSSAASCCRASRAGS